MRATSQSHRRVSEFTVPTSKGTHARTPAILICPSVPLAIRRVGDSTADTVGPQSGHRSVSTRRSQTASAGAPMSLPTTHRRPCGVRRSSIPFDTAPAFLTVPPVDPSVIDVRDLRKEYGGFVAVNGVSFDVGSGEVFGVVGPNGAGKTTTLKTLAGLVEPTAGTVEVDGAPADARETRRRLGFLPEESPLYEEMTALSYLRFFADLYDVPRGWRTPASTTPWTAWNWTTASGRSATPPRA